MKDPFLELERRLDAMRERLPMTSGEFEPFEQMRRLAGEFEPMAIDLLDRSDEFVATVDVPGVDPDDIVLEVTERMLKITTDHETATEEREGTYLRRERRRESTRRALQLPENIDTEAVHARMEHGVLHITLPKLEVESARRIDIAT